MQFVDKNILPEEANRAFRDYRDAVQKAMMPAIDLSVARAQFDERLAAQETEPLSSLEAKVPHPLSDHQTSLPDEDEMGPAYMTYEQEAEYLARTDARLSREPIYIAPALQKKLDRDLAQFDDKHWAELTPREYERQVELMNPQSQHSWLKANTKALQNLDGDDTESLAGAEAAKPPRKRGGKDKNLAKQVGDRAVERAREGVSPSAASDEEAAASASKKRTRDPDGTYRLKGGKSGGGGAKNTKRKRSGTDDLSMGKRRRVDGEDGEEDEVGDGAP